MVLRPRVFRRVKGETFWPPMFGKDIMTVLTDAFSRRFKYVRLSLTEVCNFRCQYCLPNGNEASRGLQFLSRQEIRNLTIGLKSLGVEKIRLTGGEPSLRNDLIDIIRDLKNIGIEKVALTTNGYRLSKIADELIAAGLDAINISIDSLNSENFRRITGHNRFDEIIETAKTLKERGIKAIKLNCVLLKDINHDEIYDFLELIRRNDLSVRFIELMRTGDNKEYFDAHHMSARIVENILLNLGFEAKVRSKIDGPAIEYSHPEYSGRIGIIAPYSKDFCSGCNRLRISSKGELKLCLFGEGGVSLRQFLQSQDQIPQLQNAIIAALGQKNAAHNLAQGFTGSTKHLAQIGG